MKAEVKNSFVPTKTTQKNQPLMIGYSSVTHDKTLPILQGNLNVYESAESKEGANKRGNSSRLTQSFHFFMFEPIF
ncbi:hypothetical protein, partial [Enterobacter hormaechei]|uniref:hypothetical protein n=1 Tax=Enterobacter hormaechei TaxID=158836 RepID=UPI001F402A87